MLLEILTYSLINSAVANYSINNYEMNVSLINKINSYAVFDEHDASSFPKRFRTSADLYREAKANGIPHAGLKYLRISGSGALSENYFKNIRSLTGDNVYIVDLRQESHGYVNGLPFSLFIGSNAGNKKIPYSAIDEEESNVVELIKSKDVSKIRKISNKFFGRVVRTESIQIKSKTAKTEQEVVRALGYHYKRFYIQDHHHPSKDEVYRFLDFIENLPKDAWLHFHCRGGAGRTTTFMLMYDIAKNIDKDIGLDVFINRQSLASGKQLNHLPINKPWKLLSAYNRYKFISSFYKEMSS